MYRFLDNSSWFTGLKACHSRMTPLLSNRDVTVSLQAEFTQIHAMCKYVSGWWFEPLWKILINWDDYTQYMGKQKMFQTTNQILTPKIINQVPSGNQTLLENPPFFWVVSTKNDHVDGGCLVAMLDDNRRLNLLENTPTPDRGWPRNPNIRSRETRCFPSVSRTSNAFLRCVDSALAKARKKTHILTCV